jgi:hypothetical protein
VLIHARPKIELLKIPEAAVRPGNVVWIARDGHAYRKKIKPAELLSDGVLVEVRSSGLAVGDWIIVSPLVSPHDGMRIRELSGNS